MSDSVVSGVGRSGFAAPVADAQACFRAVLGAMAHPGRPHEVTAALAPPAPLEIAAASVLLALVDADTSLWLDPDAAAARPWLAFHCGATLVEELPRAGFVLACSLPDLAALACGTDEAPEGGATLILQVPSLQRGASYRLAGPGLRDDGRLVASGLGPGFPGAWQANHARFPRGFDLLLCAGRSVAALPRGVRVEPA